MEISEDVNQVLLGSLFGDACLSKSSKNAYYCCAHSPKQKDYLFWKARTLSRHFKVKPSYGSNGPKYWIYKVRTNCPPILTALHNLFHVPFARPKRKWRKIINPLVLEKLSGIGLAIWYCDDGTYTVRDKTCALSTQGFTYDEHLLLKEYFLKKWGVKASIQRDRRNAIDKTYYKLVFNREETDKFLYILKDHIPECMVYKLGHISDKNLIQLKHEDQRYKHLRKIWYYQNHDRALQRAYRYRANNRRLVNEKRVYYYWSNLEKSRKSGRVVMRKRRLFNRERVNHINAIYYQRNKEKINRKRRDRLLRDAKYRDRKNESQRRYYHRIKSRCDKWNSSLIPPISTR
ncbi:MAG: hypothetical protein V1827_04110 [Candidatus Micrarchaeota archaeon]